MVVVEGHSSHMLPRPVPAHNCVASTGGAQQTAWHWPHTGTTSTLVTLVVVSSLPPASTCSITLGRLRLSTWPPQEIQETQEPGGGRGVLVAAGHCRCWAGCCSGVLAAVVLQPSFVINKLTPLQLQHLGPATRLVTLLTLALQP